MKQLTSRTNEKAIANAVAICTESTESDIFGRHISDADAYGDFAALHVLRCTGKIGQSDVFEAKGIGCEIQILDGDKARATAEVDIESSPTGFLHPQSLADQLLAIRDALVVNECKFQPAQVAYVGNGLFEISFEIDHLETIVGFDELVIQQEIAIEEEVAHA